MPARPLSHAQRQGRTASDRSYDRTVRASDPRLAAAKRIRSSARWQAVRAMVLREAPLCADIWGWHAAQGRVEVATQVDHVQPLHLRPDLAFELSNLSGLCTACHARKTKDEQR